MSVPRALVLGAGGQLGMACTARSPGSIEVVGVTRRECDITDYGALERCLDRIAPKVVVNAAAYTAVDDAEDHPEQANAINADAPSALAEICAQRGARLVHLSTDFVFDGAGTAPYAPDSRTAPLGVYGASKLIGEQAVTASGVSHAVVRTSWVYAATGHNFLLTMLRLMRERSVVRVVNDQIGSPTSATGLAEICWALALREEVSGVFHWSDRGEVSWYDFACAIRDEATALGLLAEPVSVEPIANEAFPTKARRPRYSVLDVEETCSLLRVAPRPWREALRDVLRSVSAMEEVRP
ncbi:MAG: dTDP-4-dehydrorhamnose reductase [Luminiphilus sp.]|nr:dTDP-4-dehydrorhamnose reductase [Luminiphilus sp.]